MKKEIKAFIIIALLLIGVIILINLLINASLEEVSIQDEKVINPLDSQDRKQGLRLEEESQGEYDKPLAAGEPLLN